MIELFDNPPSVSLERQLAAVHREIRMRRQVYPTRIAQGRMTQAKADEEIAVMEAVAKTIAELIAKQR